MVVNAKSKTRKAVLLYSQSITVGKIQVSSPRMLWEWWLFFVPTLLRLSLKSGRLERIFWLYMLKTPSSMKIGLQWTIQGVHTFPKHLPIFWIYWNINTSTQPITIFFKILVSDKNVSPILRKRVKGDNFNVFKSNLYILTYHLNTLLQEQ